MTASRLLVVENDPSDDARRLGRWLAEAGLELVTLRPHAGDALPSTLDGWDGVLVMGGGQDAYPAPDGTPAAWWYPALIDLLITAVTTRVPTLGICLGGQLLVQAMGGKVEPSRNGPEVGAFLVARRDAAARDPLFAGVPFTPDVYQWHVDEISRLPPGAVLLAAASNMPHQAFRIGERAWGTQFHIECDLDMLTAWAADDHGLLDEYGVDADAMLARCAAVLDDVEDAWRPFAERFAALVRGLQGSMPLPVIEA